METESYYISLEDYKDDSRIERIEGDEGFDSILIEWGSERFYSPNKVINS